MAISKFDYSQKIGLYGIQINKAADEYADYSNAATFETEEELGEFRKGWLLIVDNFRVIQSNINELEIPKGHEDKGQELREAYQKYVDYVEEKTMKFGLVDIKEINMIERLEAEQSSEIKKITEELKKEMFDK